MVDADPATILFATTLVTAVTGLAVAALAYRGYRRNKSETMRYLAVGIALITAGPFVLNYVLTPGIDVPDAVRLLGVLLATIAGLLSIVYSLDGT